MPNETPPPLLVDAVKASALKLKEKQAALEARAHELETLRARLDQEHAELDTRAARLAADREANDRERQGLDDVRASMERDLGAINKAREKLAEDEEALQRAAVAVEERERLIKGDEERVARLAQAFTGQMKDSESKLDELLQRGEALMKLQTDWLASVEAREKELRTIGEEMHVRQSEVVRQYESLAALKGGLKEELHRLLAEHEMLSSKEKSILEAEKYLASALEIEVANFDREESPPQPITPAAPEPVAQPETPEPTPAATPEPAQEPPVAVAPSVQEEIPPEPEAKPRATKGEATERLSKAVEAWKRARDAGWKVVDIRKTVKAARDAIEGGDYERALGCTAEILEQLQAAAAAR
ncbi:MAG TPA: hypothetical protein VEY12_06410 [Thermoplasmata archaeon]|nr:hypothetical protein [Thermoplasmata archaeon]